MIILFSILHVTESCHCLVVEVATMSFQHILRFNFIFGVQTRKAFSRVETLNAKANPLNFGETIDHDCILKTYWAIIYLLIFEYQRSGRMFCLISMRWLNQCLFVGYEYKFNLTNLWVEIISGQLLLNFFAQAAQYIHDNLKLDWNKGGGGLVVRRQLPTLVVHYLKKIFCIYFVTNTGLFFPKQYFMWHVLLVSSF